MSPHLSDTEDDHDEDMRNRAFASYLIIMTRYFEVLIDDDEEESRECGADR
jgi:hypothetical protein